MGTRALIHIKKNGKFSATLATIYVQFDGYPDGLGKQIIDFIGDKKISNGIKSGNFNSMGCFAASLIAHLKTEAGNVYIKEPDTCDVWENYTYTLYRNGDEILDADKFDSILCSVDVYLEDLLVEE